MEISTSNTSTQAIAMLTSLTNEETLDMLIQLHAVVPDWLRRQSLEAGIETLAGRLGMRIMREDNKLVKLK